MAMEAVSSSNELFNFIIYETISATPCSNNNNAQDSLLSLSPNHNANTFFLNSNSNNNNNVVANNHDEDRLFFDQTFQQTDGRDLSTKCEEDELLLGDHYYYRRSDTYSNNSIMMMKKKKRKRKARVCKNKEEAENQRMTHIAVERNRRKQMNEHLSVLRSIMPESYVQRGDQASIVGGAIEFVKELEHLLQSLEAKKLQQNLQGITNANTIDNDNNNTNSDDTTSTNHDDHQDKPFITTTTIESEFSEPPFSQFFVYPQYIWSQASNKYTSKTKAAIADIEVTLIETHACVRILSRRSFRQLSKLVAGFYTLHLTVLHLNVTTMSPLVLYSVSLKVEEECLLNSVDDIASAVHHMIRIIEEEATALC